MSAELAPTGVPDLQGDAAADAASQSDGTFDDTPTEVSGASADAALAELRRQAQELLADLAGVDPISDGDERRRAGLRRPIEGADDR